MCITCMLGALGGERMAGVADACEPPVGAWQQVLSLLRAVSSALVLFLLVANDI